MGYIENSLPQEAWEQALRKPLGEVVFGLTRVLSRTARPHCKKKDFYAMRLFSRCLVTGRVFPGQTRGLDCVTQGKAKKARDIVFLLMTVSIV